jgi:hypothetical protein
MPKKIYHYVYWTKDLVDVEVEATSKKEAEKKLDEMCNNDEIRWEKAYSVDGGHRLEYIERKEA